MQGRKREGIEEGIKEGQREGEYRKAVATAIAMKKDGLSVEAIHKYTGLSKEEIEKL